MVQQFIFTAIRGGDLRECRCRLTSAFMITHFEQLNIYSKCDAIAKQQSPFLGNEANAEVLNCKL